MLGIDDNKKIGIGLLMLGLALLGLGVIMLFDRAFIIIGNLCFLGGLYFLVGLSGTVNFFVKKGKLKGSALYFVGFSIIVIFKFTFIGFCLQIYGILILFKSFFPFLYESACNLPFVGRYIRDASFLRKLMEGGKKKPPV